jgi:hypothetical protein
MGCASLRFALCGQVLAALLAVWFGDWARGDEPPPVPTKFFDAAAREIRDSIKSGDGWAVVSARSKVTLIEGIPPGDCVKFRVVTDYKFGKANEQDFIELKYTEETDWIGVDLKLPTASGSSLAAAKKANEAVGKIDEFLGPFEAVLPGEKDAAQRELGKKLIMALKKQRAACVDLISKDIQAIR